MIESWVNVDFVAGALSALTCRLVISPIDVVKIRLQLSTSPLKPTLSKTTAIGTVIKDLVQKEGYRAFWKGNNAAILQYVIYGSTQFYSLSLLKTSLATKPSTMQDGLLGGLAASVATVVSYPFDLLRTRHASHTSSQSISASLRSLTSPLQFYAGLSPSLIQIYPYMSIVFGSYSYLQHSATFGQYSFLNGVVAGVLGKTITLPFDVLRKRMQVINHPSLKQEAGATSGLFRVFRLLDGIRRREGLAGLFRGFTPSIAKSGVASGVTLYSFSVYKKFLLGSAGSTSAGH